MPVVKEVLLKIDLPNKVTANVTVTYTIEFQADELARPFSVAIELYGEDKYVPPIGTGARPITRTQLLYTFTFGTHPLQPKRPYMTITPAHQVYTNTVSQMVSQDTLNEDPETREAVILGNVYHWAVEDEVFALVRVSQSVSAVSEVVSIAI